jgi:hypothetical protein
VHDTVPARLENFRQALQEYVAPRLRNVQETDHLTVERRWTRGSGTARGEALACRVEQNPFSHGFTSRVTG